MTKYERKKMIERIVMDGRQDCIKCGRDVTEGFNTYEEIMNSIETPRINSMLPRSVKNCNLVHKNCAHAMAREEVPSIEQIVSVLQKGPAFQKCKVCYKDLTGLDVESMERLAIHRIRGVSYLIHPACADMLK